RGDFDHVSQRDEALGEAPAVLVDERAMADLAGRAGLFAVKMNVRARQPEQRLERRHASEEVHHRGEAPRRGVAERPAEDRAKVVLELARDRAFYRPVAGIMYARRHFVREQLAVRMEELEREHAAIVEAVEQRADSLLRDALQRPILERRDGRVEDA